MVSVSLSHHNLWPPESGSTAFRGFATAASVHACHHVSRHLRLDFHLRSSLKKLQHFSDDARMKFARYQRVIVFNGANFLKSRVDIRLSQSSPFVCFFNGGESRLNPRGGEEGSSNPETSKRNTVNGRRWTNVLLAINVIMYIAQIASDGKVLTWGAKINSLIERGQLWRLATASVLHANPMHLMINCYSLNSIGPTAESLGGPKRFLAVYLTSAVAKF